MSVTSESNEDATPAEVVVVESDEKTRVVGMGDGRALDVAPCSTSCTNLTCPGPRVEGVCERVAAIGSEMRGSAGSASSAVIATALELGFSGIACASLNL